MNIINATSPQPWRVQIATDAIPPTNVADYAIVRQDGGYSAAAFRLAWMIGTNTVELALTEALEPSVVYVVSIPGASGAPTYVLGYYGVLSNAPAQQAAGEDPDAEAYGVDADWLNDSLDPTGDLIKVSGPPCLTNDIQAVAVINPGEIFHRPDDGAALPTFVNDAGNQIEISRMHSSLKQQWLKDSRIKSVDSIVTTVDSEGKALVKASLTDSIANQSFNANVTSRAV